MSRALHHDIPGTDWRIETDELKQRGWTAVFGDHVPSALPLVVEIGFGRGEFLMDMAAREPETAFIGIEYSFKRVLKMARRLARSEILNTRLVQATAQEVVRDVLVDASVSNFWINFPDPWPKKRHARRRLIQADFVALLSRRLVPGGAVHVATDHEDYAEWIHEVLRNASGLENRFAPEPFLSEIPGRMSTAYELEWRALGRALRFFCYTKPGGSCAGSDSPRTGRGASAR